jgi:HD superfamily phosphohydrolase
MSVIKTKIINDAVHGFITIPNQFLLQLMDHPYFQRLRRIKQLGLTDWVYPNAVHTRFSHALGAMFLYHQSIINLRQKGVKITEQEKIAGLCAIMMHDIGHGPFSHALENSIVSRLNHEEISMIFMNRINQEMDGELDMAISIFEGSYKKPFLHQLIHGQLDVDRMDYLRRDSFFTGVSEGVIGTQRIVKMMNVVDNQLVVEAKGIYSIENFLSSRRIMYWQVYLHKTVVAAEYLLMNILKRARHLVLNGGDVFASPALLYFLENQVEKSDFLEDEQVLNHFADLDDVDILGAIKVWQNHSDQTLSILSKSLINRSLFHVEFQEKPFTQEYVYQLKIAASKLYNVNIEEASYLVFTDSASNEEYNQISNQIKILENDQTVKNLDEVSQFFHYKALTQRVTRYFLCFPKALRYES